MQKLTKQLFLLMVFILGIAYSCKKEGNQVQANTVIGNKYAKYDASVRKAADLKEWLATLQKAEEVKLLEEFEQPTKGNKTVTIAKIQLADDQIGFIESRHLANDPIVFTEDTRVFIRPAVGSKVVITIPRGTIGFILDEKEGWTQVYIGKIDDQYITKHWVESNKYTVDAPLVIDARDYESALGLIKEKKYEDAKPKLERLSQGASFFSELASKKLEEIEEEELKAEEEQKAKEEAEKNAPAETQAPAEE